MASFLGPLLSGGASALVGGLLGGGGATRQREVKRPKFQRQLIDQLLEGLQGSGPFASLFQADQEGFQQGVVDPLTQIFQQQTAPGIQQRFIASGQQRGTPLESALSRGGLDVQRQINQLFLPFQQGAQNRQQQALQTLLGLGAPGTTSQITPLGGAFAGLQQSGAVPDIIQAIAGLGGQQQIQPEIGPGDTLSQQLTGGTERRGFA